MPECSSWEQGTDEKIKNSERSYKLAGGKKKEKRGESYRKGNIFVKEKLFSIKPQPSIKN